MTNHLKVPRHRRHSTDYTVTLYVFLQSFFGYQWFSITSCQSVISFQKPTTFLWDHQALWNLNPLKRVEVNVLHNNAFLRLATHQCHFFQEELCQETQFWHWQLVIQWHKIIPLTSFRWNSSTNFLKRPTNKIPHEERLKWAEQQVSSLYDLCAELLIIGLSSLVAFAAVAISMHVM